MHTVHLILGDAIGVDDFLPTLRDDVFDRAPGGEEDVGIELDESGVDVQESVKPFS